MQYSFHICMKIERFKWSKTRIDIQSSYTHIKNMRMEWIKHLYGYSNEYFVHRNCMLCFRMVHVPFMIAFSKRICLHPFSWLLRSTDWLLAAFKSSRVQLHERHLCFGTLTRISSIDSSIDFTTPCCSVALIVTGIRIWLLRSAIYRALQRRSTKLF